MAAPAAVPLLALSCKLMPPPMQYSIVELHSTEPDLRVSFREPSSLATRDKLRSFLEARYPDQRGKLSFFSEAGNEILNNASIEVIKFVNHFSLFDPAVTRESWQQQWRLLQPCPLEGEELSTFVHRSHTG